MTQKEEPAIEDEGSSPAPRTFVTTPVAFRAGSTVGIGAARDLSATGMYVRTAQFLPYGTPLELRFRPDPAASAEVVEIRGVVARATRASDAEGAGVGVRFTERDSPQIERLASVVSESTVRSRFDAARGAASLEGSEDGDRYEVLGLLGSGATSNVYRAHDRHDDRPVALKVLKAHIAEDPEIVERLRREAALVRMIGHPRIADVFESGTINGFPYLAMELVEGAALSRLLFERQALDEAETVRVLLDVSDAVAAAHQRDIVHRDLKPSNILVSPEVGAKVVDFGIARARLQTRLTQAGSFLGTPSYSAPEQLVGATASPRTDVYALGCIAFRCLTGHERQSARDIAATLALLHSGPVPALREHGAAVSAGLEQIVVRCLAHDPADRYADASAVRTALARLEAHPPAPRRRRALIGESDPCSAEHLRVILERAGWEARVVDDGFALIEIALGQPPDLVVVTSTLASIGGLEAIQILRAQPSTARIGCVLVSGFDVDGETVAFLDTAKFVKRPVDEAFLVSAASEACAAPS
ncbi:MAG: protein kinase [bacterium]